MSIQVHQENCCRNTLLNARLELLTMLFLLLVWGPKLCAQSSNLVANGSFELTQTKAGLPDAWALAGNSAVKQQLTLDTGRDGKRCAKLDCTAFADNGPDFHVMLCQVGKVAVRRTQWYRLSLWARTKDLKSGGVEVSLVNTRRWEGSGLAEAFTPTSEWQHFEFLFRASADLPADASRLQFWYKSTGTLWLDDIELTESSTGQQWYPQLSTQGVKNFVPNSSFECGSANWGSYTYGLSGWAGNLYRLEGVLDETVSQHGTRSLKINLTPTNLPIFYFDYYEPVRQPVRRVLVANLGWFKVQPGEKLTLSAYLRTDVPGIAAQMAVIEAPSRLSQKAVTVSTDWQRYEYTFVPSQPFMFIAVGLDLDSSNRDSATLWLDSVQLERGAMATAYEPRQELESFIQTAAEGNIFTNVDQGFAVNIQAFNNTAEPKIVRGNFGITDFFDQKLFNTQPSFTVPAHGRSNTNLQDLCRGLRGFFRANWEFESSTQALRCAMFEPVRNQSADSPLGFNHAYPYDFLVRLARQAGVAWWRDWSAKWQTVEPEKGKFQWSVPDAQINRVLNLDSEVEVLLPFPSSSWSTSARMDEVQKAAGNNSYLQTRLPVACAPKDWSDFGRYAAEVARHYYASGPHHVTTFQVLNEPIYTDYALPKEFGYGLTDYIRSLETAYRAIKKVDPRCQVVGGISANVESAWTRQFVEQDGLRYLDVLDLHMYDPPRPAENYDPAFSRLEANMRSHGGLKPVWITEWGCYADDDPPCFPQTVGDSTMNRCRWPSERAATEHIVKFTAVTFAHGLRKLFFHAGTCGTINCPDAGGVLFEYGGTPRKMLPGVAALASIFGTPDRFEQKIEHDGLLAYVFRKQNHPVAIAWCISCQKHQIKLGPSLRCMDVMGNQSLGESKVIGESPVYLLSDSLEAITQGLNH